MLFFLAFSSLWGFANEDLPENLDHGLTLENIMNLNTTTESSLVQGEESLSIERKPAITGPATFYPTGENEALYR